MNMFNLFPWEKALMLKVWNFSPLLFSLALETQLRL